MHEHTHTTHTTLQYQGPNTEFNASSTRLRYKHKSTNSDPLLQSGDSLHSLSCLSANVNELVHFKLVLLNMNVSKQSGPVTPLGYYSQLWLACPTHEQENISMAGLSGDTRRRRRKRRRRRRKNEGRRLVWSKIVLREQRKEVGKDKKGRERQRDFDLQQHSHFILECLHLLFRWIWYV